MGLVTTHRSDLSAMDVKKTGAGEADLLDQQSVGTDARRKGDHGHVGCHERQPPIPGGSAVSGQQERAQQAHPGPASLEGGQYRLRSHQTISRTLRLRTITMGAGAAGLLVTDWYVVPGRRNPTRGPAQCSWRAPECGRHQRLAQLGPVVAVELNAAPLLIQGERLHLRPTTDAAEQLHACVGNAGMGEPVPLCFPYANNPFLFHR